MYFESSYPLAQAFNPFSIRVFFFIWTSFCPTFIYYLKQKKMYLPDREASLIKREYCRCGPHPLQVISPRARPPLVKGASCIAQAGNQLPFVLHELVFLGCHLQFAACSYGCKILQPYVVATVPMHS